jgi:nucleoside 2-deoxyribosyltransferase
MEQFSIIGGTYYEKCEDPHWDELYGSGFRAAVALSSLVENFSFHTYADNQTKEILKVLVRQLGIQLHAKELNKSIIFHYTHPLANPDFFPELSQYKDNTLLTVEGFKNVLCYGMLEGNAIIQAERVVYDPQRPFQPLSFWENGSKANDLTMVLNYKEASKLAQAEDIELIKNYLINKERVAAAIIKNGADGAFVIQGDDTITTIPAFITNKVWPIGSGDIFSAYFTYQYLLKETGLKEAAYQASLATAYYANSKLTILPESFSSNSFKPFTKKTSQAKRVYLAGPFFSMSQRWMIHETREALLKCGFRIFSPIHDVGIGGPDEVVQKDIDAIKEADVMVAIGDGLDSGTLFEIGFARALNKTVIVLVENEKETSLTMLIGSGCIVERDFSTFIYKTVWEAYK